MLRRSILELSSRRSIRRVPRQSAVQWVPLIISSRKEFSTSSQISASSKSGPTGKPSESNGSVSKVVVGTAVVAGAALLAYHNGYLDQYIGGKEKEKHNSLDSDKFNDDGNAVKVSSHSDKEPNTLTPLVESIVSSHSAGEPNTSDSAVEQAVQNVETGKDIPQPKTSSEIQVEGTIPAEEKYLGKSYNDSVVSSEQNASPPQSSEGSVEKEGSESNTSKDDENAQVTVISSRASAIPEKDEQKKMPTQHIISEDRYEDALGKGVEAPSSLLEAYHLSDKTDDGIVTKATEDFLNAIEELNNGDQSNDGKLVLDFLQAIHAAEKWQAELDARAFAEEKKALKEKYEKELRNSRARELMLTEEAAISEKELKRERTKAAATIKSIQEKMEEKLRMELEQKESEAEFKLTKAEELAKAELAAAITREKAAQIEKMAEADLHINALCMAFYARSEEARKSYFAHKLALGSLALEDALSKGLPIQKEVDALYSYLDGIEKDSVLDLVLSSLPEDTRNHGTETLLQLNQKFDSLKGTLRHFSLIPPGGGGILTHSLAHVASWLKVKEADQSGDGIESVISRVESYLREGKLAEAADALEEGVRGSQAERIVIDWVRQARNRAITEQGLTFLQSYATCLSLA
ncbi:hypothetical protein Ddye_008955 [Dipteronia dyeriana]|uniref:MICOS complex subunit MIC60 n=1 Tax=Dipteronia dyeriana TaxID=168575 RepID=A0AAE0CMF6_9ROSI|nr:hypothetical protein Ddye_008955 [Dipteronia dyeriana]